MLSLTDRLATKLLQALMRRKSRVVFSENASRPGRFVMSIAQYKALYDEATPPHRRKLLGHSPGGAAALAGISRQAIHNAIDRGTLTAYYVFHDHGGDLAWIVIPDESLQDYIDRNRRKAG